MYLTSGTIPRICMGGGGGGAIANILAASSGHSSFTLRKWKILQKYGGAPPPNLRLSRNITYISTLQSMKKAPLTRAPSLGPCGEMTINTYINIVVMVVHLYLRNNREPTVGPLILKCNRAFSSIRQATLDFLKIDREFSRIATGEIAIS